MIPDNVIEWKLSLHGWVTSGRQSCPGQTLHDSRTLTPCRNLEIFPEFMELHHPCALCTSLPDSFPILCLYASIRTDVVETMTL